ncbi:MAG: pyrroline-5-carboxylate reductase [Spirochaetota bacterium]|nr:pyrroline-5-carboxylate reductase [Spirochaetota bacterium]
MLRDKSIGCIGAGNMGSAIIAHLSKNIDRNNISIFDIDEEKIEYVKKNYNIVTHYTLQGLTDRSDIIIIAVKPDILPSVVKEIKGQLAKKIIVSIAAGIAISTIEDILKTPHKIVRVMPNMPAMIGSGMSVISPNINVEEESLNMVLEIFSYLGKVMILSEEYMDAVTALSGCGPAYGFMLIQAMTDSGVRMGIPRDKALILSAQTILGAAEMLIRTGEDPVVLRGRVTSPGGATIEAVHMLERLAFSGIVMDAIEAAKTRSKELGLK